MIEIFKTNVKNRDEANQLICRMHQTFTGYKISFDLEDCDKIMRVECAMDTVRSSCLIYFLNEAGFKAEILEDEIFQSLKTVY